MAYPKISNPAFKDWIDQLNDSLHRLRAKTSKNISQFLQQRCACFHLGRISYTPNSSECSNSPKIKTKKSETFSLGEVESFCLFFVELHIKFCQLLQQSAICPLSQPCPFGVTMNQNHQSSHPGEPPPRCSQTRT